MAVVYTQPEVEQTPWTEREVVKTLVQPQAPFEYHRNFVCCPNVSYGFLDWEADLLVCNRNGYVTEVEVKVSAADWMSDKDKRKWRVNELTGARLWHWQRIKTFYYAAPLALALRWEEFGVPEFAGVIGLERRAYGRVGFTVVRKPKSIEGHRKLTEKEKLKLARLTALRIWG